MFPSAEIYGGFRSTYDYGPIGVLMLRNVKDAWWRSMVQLRDDVVGLDAAILSPPGDLGGLRPPRRTSPTRWSTAGTAGLATASTSSTTPRCARPAAREGRSPRRASSTSCSRPTPARSRTRRPVAYLRPETAQGMFVNFTNVLNASRKKPPFGIAQIGKSFRNEITPGNFVFRTREFEQMEMEYFVPPDEAAKWYEYWCEERYRWYVDLGIPEDKLRLRAHDADELSHYSIGHLRRGVPLPVGLGRARGHRPAHRLRPQGPRRALGREARLLRPGHQHPLHART